MEQCLEAMILEKVPEYATSLGHSEFEASVVWIEKFRKRNELFQKTVSGKSADAPVTVWETWSLEVPEILKEFIPGNLCKFDAIGLF